MFVLGTAGHIDHGKSSLVKAMTGIDPDRLPEEKERGMTIDLGFAWLTLPDGDTVGLVDVPGHERFVRNMVAGAGGINAAMLVIAADDGWMPQTQEHFDILSLLDIKHGLIAVTKKDLVDEDWLELIVSDIKTRIRGTFLDGAPVIPVSSVTGDGVGTIVRAIADIGQKLKRIDDIGKSRLFIDRAFVLTGIGVVVTGTSRGGGFAADADVYHFPTGDRIKVRSLQSHEQKVDRVGPGTRVAVNLSGVDRTEISRGDVVTGFDYDLRPTCLAVWIRHLTGSTVALKEGRRVLLIFGTTETEASLRPFADGGLKPGQEGLAILKTDRPVAAFVEDHFILRLPTPQVTVGGGRVLDLLDYYPRRKELAALADYLTVRQTGGLRAYILTELERRLFTGAAGLLKYSNFSADAVSAEMEKLVDDGKVIRFEDYAASSAKVSALLDNIARELAGVHKSKSYLKGLTAEELMRRLSLPDQAQGAMLFRYYESAARLKRTQQFYHLPDFVPVLDDAMKDEADKIMADVNKAGHNYLSFEEIEARYPGSRRTVNFLRDDRRLMGIGTQFVMTRREWDEIIGFIEKALDAPGKFTVAEFRDRFGSSRKFALPVLEHLDRLNVTRREGDYRIKGGRFDERHSL